MNINNINKAIAIMERVKLNNSLYMPTYQSNANILESDFVFSRSEKDLHACGNAACLAGHIAISPEFKADGGDVGSYGEPLYDGCGSYSAIGRWMGIEKMQIAVDLVYDGVLYDRPWKEVTPDDVIRVLTYLRDNGETATFVKLKQLEKETNHDH